MPESENQERKHQSSLTRRSALKLFTGMLGLAAILHHPMSALADDVTDATNAANDAAGKLADTQKQLADAQAQYNDIQNQLNQIQSDYEDMARQQSQTLDQIEDVQRQIDATQEAVDQKQAELDEKRGILSKRMSSDYKAGKDNFLSVILNSESFEDLFQNVYYMDKISAQDSQIIEETKAAKEALDQQRAHLIEEKSQLDELNSQQLDQMNQMSAKRDEVSQLLGQANSSVQDLLKQQDSDLMAYNQAEEARLKAEAQAQAQAQARSQGGTPVAGAAANVVTGSGSLADVLNSCNSTPFAGVGYCATWVTNVFVNAGVGRYGGNANDMYARWCGSSNRGGLQPGMIIAVSSCDGDAAGRIYGHVGIYVGNNTVMDNYNTIRHVNLDDWINAMSHIVTPRWGWMGGVALS